MSLPTRSDTGAAGAGAMQMTGSPPTEVSRIIGTDGHYAATMKGSDGQSKTFYVGDHTPGGGTIEKISASEVVVNQAGAKHVLHVKNVDMVFGNTP
jgi:type IV pilus biogenesis protein PilP